MEGCASFRRATRRRAGYGPNKRLPLKVGTRTISIYKDPAVILASQLKEIYIDAEVEIIDTAQWFIRVNKKDYSVGLNTTGADVPTWISRDGCALYYTRGETGDIFVANRGR